MTIRITKTKEAVPGTGSFGVFVDDKPIKYFHYDDNPGRRLRPEQVDQETAKKQAQEFARKQP